MEDKKKRSPFSAHRPMPRGKLHATDWLAGVVPDTDCNIVEVGFKNTRNGFYVCPDTLSLKAGDIVAVEAAPGHDIGRVIMTGPLVRLQMKKCNAQAVSELKKVFRIATESDLQRFDEARAREHDTMIRSRRIADELQLNMKIGDVEYQGDGGKAIFYYIADERVDFRKLIRVLADTFKVRIEMKQIGARQEAGRIGGIGPCGRPLCCSTWMTHFVSVGTGAARMQDLSMNPQKLAGQCAKLKCCLNFEIDSYAEARKRIPAKDITLETVDATYHYFKSDILAGTVTYSTDPKIPANLVTVTTRRAHDIIAANRRGEKVESLEETAAQAPPPKEYIDLAEQDDLTRFDKSRSRRKKKPREDKPREERVGERQPKKERPQHKEQRDRRPQQKPQPRKGTAQKPKTPHHNPDGGKTQNDAETSQPS